MSDTIRAALWMIGAIFSFSLMAVAGRAVSGVHDTFEIMLFRSLTGIVIVAIVAGSLGTWRDASLTHWKLHGLRNIAHFTGQNLWFYALTLIPLAQLFALEFTTPIWVMLLAPFLLKEKITAVGAFAAALGFVGVLIVARPDPSNINIGLVAAAASAIAFAFTAIFTRKLTRTESITTILIYLTVLQAIFGLICAGYDGDVALPTRETLPWIIGIGCAGLFAHFCLTTALSLAPASIVMPIDFARLPTIAVVGMLLYQEDIDIYIFLGAAIIFAANYINILYQTRKTIR